MVASLLLLISMSINISAQTWFSWLKKKPIEKQSFLQMQTFQLPKSSTTVIVAVGPLQNSFISQEKKSGNNALVLPVTNNFIGTIESVKMIECLAGLQFQAYIDALSKGAKELNMITSVPAFDLQAQNINKIFLAREPLMLDIIQNNYNALLQLKNVYQQSLLQARREEISNIAFNAYDGVGQPEYARIAVGSVALALSKITGFKTIYFMAPNVETFMVYTKLFNQELHHGIGAFEQKPSEYLKSILFKAHESLRAKKIYKSEPVTENIKKMPFESESMYPEYQDILSDIAFDLPQAETTMPAEKDIPVALPVPQNKILEEPVLASTKFCPVQPVFAPSELAPEPPAIEEELLETYAPSAPPMEEDDLGDVPSSYEFPEPSAPAWSMEDQLEYDLNSLVHSLNRLAEALKKINIALL